MLNLGAPTVLSIYTHRHFTKVSLTYILYRFIMTEYNLSVALQFVRPPLLSFYHGMENRQENIVSWLTGKIMLNWLM